LCSRVYVLGVIFLGVILSILSWPYSLACLWHDADLDLMLFFLRGLMCSDVAACGSCVGISSLGLRVCSAKDWDVCRLQ
jgi:hypothetical protein